MKLFEYQLDWVKIVDFYYWPTSGPEIYFYKDGGSAAIEFTPQLLKIYFASAKKFTSQVQKIYSTSEVSAVNFFARAK